MTRENIKKFFDFFVNNNVWLFSICGVLAAALSFFVIYYYSFLIGRPHLFLDSMHIGPDIFFLLLFFVFGMLCFFILIYSNSLIFALMIHVLYVRPPLKNYAISVVLRTSFFLLFVLLLLAGFAGLQFPEFIIALYLIAFSVFLYLAVFSVAGNHVLNRKYNKIKNMVWKNNRDNLTVYRRKRLTRCGKIVNEMYLDDVKYLQRFRVVMFVGSLLKSSLRGSGEYIKIKGNYLLKRYFSIFVKILLVAAFSFLMLFFCMYMFTSSWEVFSVAQKTEGVKGYQPYSAALIFLLYGMLPGVIFVRSSYKGFKRFKQVIVVSSVAFAVVCIFTYGVFSSLVSYSIMMMGVRDAKPSFYSIPEKYYRSEMIFSSWGALKYGSRYQLNGMVLYRFSSLVYLCPPDFYKKDLRYWRENSERCIVGSYVDIEPGVR